MIIVEKKEIQKILFNKSFIILNCKMKKDLYFTIIQYLIKLAKYEQSL
jgi:hypothetical protein